MERVNKSQFAERLKRERPDIYCYMYNPPDRDCARRCTDIRKADMTRRKYANGRSIIPKYIRRRDTLLTAGYN